MNNPFHGMVSAVFHRLANLKNKKTGGPFCHPITDSHITCRKTFGTGHHFKAYEKCLAQSEFYFTKERIHRKGLGMTTNIAGYRKILTYLKRDMVTFNTFENIFPFNNRAVFLAIQVRFEPIKNSRRFWRLKISI